MVIRGSTVKEDVMALDILVYGHGDKSENRFPTDAHMDEYISGGIFHDESSRYRYSQRKCADIIVLSRDGQAHGHFEVAEMVEPTDEDIEFFPPVKQVYLVKKSVRYSNKVRLHDVGVSHYQFGKRLDEQEFQAILNLAGEREEFTP